MKKSMALMLVLGLMSLLAASGLVANTPSNTISLAGTPSDVSAKTQEPSSISNTNKSDASKVPKRIKITAGNAVMYATMKDNRTAQEFIELLPLTLKAFDRIGLVKSTVLPQSISDDGERTRKYAIGSIFYWPEGPEVAFCYSDHLSQTVVSIIHIGMLESGVEHFQNYTGELLVELANEVPVQAAPEKQ